MEVFASSFLTIGLAVCSHHSDCRWGVCGHISGCRSGCMWQPFWLSVTTFLATKEDVDNHLCGGRSGCPWPPFWLSVVTFSGCLWPPFLAVCGKLSGCPWGAHGHLSSCRSGCVWPPFWLPVATFLAVGEGLSVATIRAVGGGVCRRLSGCRPKGATGEAPPPPSLPSRCAHQGELTARNHKQILMIPMLAPAIRNRKKRKHGSQNTFVRCVPA